MIILINRDFFSFYFKLFLGVFLIFFQYNLIYAQKQKTKLDAVIKEWASPDDFPDHVIISATKNPSTSIGINWRTEPSNKIGYA